MKVEDLEDGQAVDQRALLCRVFRCWRLYSNAVRLAKRRLMRQAWAAWKQKARDGARKELLRRRAARFAYHQALRRGLRSFQGLVDYGYERRAVAAFAAWVTYTLDRRVQRDRYMSADAHARKKLLHGVLVRGFGGNVAERRSKRLATDRADKASRHRLLRKGISCWSRFQIDENNRDRHLDTLLQSWKNCGATITRRNALLRDLFTRWTDRAQTKHAQQLVVANFRGRSHLRILSACFSAWVSHLSALRWRDITTERAKTHRRRSLLRKALNVWASRVGAMKRERDQTRVSLIHWKLSLERRTFAKWVAYIQLKREKRQRLHDALQFRHTQLVTHGIRQWLTAALHLQNEREERVTCVAAAHTTRLWRRVASIARHWRALTVRRRQERLGQIENQSMSRNATSYGFDAVDWLERPARSRPIPANSADRTSRVELPIAGATLSPFVMLPRDRPLPRKPVELLLSNPETEDIRMRSDQAIEQTNATRSDGRKPREVARYGFQFTGTTAQKKPFMTDAMRLELTRDSHQLNHAPTPSVSTSLQSKEVESESYTKLFDALEQELLRLEARKREWRNFQQRLHEVREKFRTIVNISSGDRDGQSIETHVLDLEREYQKRYRDWSDAQKRLRDVAAELEQLREDMHLLQVLG